MSLRMVSIIAGMTIFTSTGLAQELAWPPLRVVPTAAGPVLGTTSGPDATLFSDIVGAVRLADGQVLVGDRGNARAVLFSESGAPVWTSGRRGDGPNEYRNLGWIGRCLNGPFALFDSQKGRVTFLTDAGRLLLTQTLVGSYRGRMLWCDGTEQAVVLVPARLTEPPVGGRRFSMSRALLRYGANDRVDTLAAGSNDLYMSSEQPTYSEVPLGRAVLTAAGGRFTYFCLNHEASCIALDLVSGTRDSFVVRLPRRPVREDDWRRALQDFVSQPAVRGGGAEASNTLLRVLREVAKPATFPRLRDVQVDAAGRLWLRTYEDYRATSTSWLVLTPRGTPLATVVLPGSLQPLEIGHDYLVGVTQDVDGVERVRTFRFSQLPP